MGLPRGARLYLACVALVGAVSGSAALSRFTADAGDLLAFALLGAAAAVAQLCAIETGRNHGFPTAVVFLVAGALVLPPELVALLALAQHGPELVRGHCPWYIHTFNTANYTINALAAYGTARLVAGAPLGGEDVRLAAGGLTACIAFVGLNHLLLATMLRLARGRSFRASALFSIESLSIDLVLAILGVALAAFSRSNPVLIVAAVAPVFLIHRLLSMKASLGDSAPPSRLLRLRGEAAAS